MEADGGKKRKRSKTSGKTASLSKQEGHGLGHSTTLKVVRVAAAKVVASTVCSMATISKSELMVVPTP